MKTFRLINRNENEQDVVFDADQAIYENCTLVVTVGDMECCLKFRVMGKFDLEPDFEPFAEQFEIEIGDELADQVRDYMVENDYPDKVIQKVMDNFPFAVVNVSVSLDTEGDIDLGDCELG